MDLNHFARKIMRRASARVIADPNSMGGIVDVAMQNKESAEASVCAPNCPRPQEQGSTTCTSSARATPRDAMRALGYAVRWARQGRLAAKAEEPARTVSPTVKQYSPTSLSTSDELRRRSSSPMSASLLTSQELCRRSASPTPTSLSTPSVLERRSASPTPHGDAASTRAIVSIQV